MKVLHLRQHRWVRHRKITAKLTFASPFADAVALCKADFAKLHKISPDMVYVTTYEPRIYCSMSTLTGSILKVYEAVDYTRTVPTASPDISPRLFS